VPKNDQQIAGLAALEAVGPHDLADEQAGCQKHQQIAVQLDDDHPERVPEHGEPQKAVGVDVVLGTEDDVSRVRPRYHEQQHHRRKQKADGSTGGCLLEDELVGEEKK